MPLVRDPDGKGLFYIPDGEAARPRKHPCPSCSFCMQCSASRCAACLKQQSSCRRGEGCGRAERRPE